MELQNLNIRLIEYRQILWTCLPTRDPQEVHEELLSSRVQSGIVQDAALIMSESLWLRLVRCDRFMKSFVQCNTSEYTARGVQGVWTAHTDDQVVLLTDSNVHKQDKTISDMSFAFVHLSQVRYPRQYDAPLRLQHKK